MKKIILSAAAVLVFGFVSAQDMKFGIKGGVNFATLMGDSKDAKMKIGFHVGALAEFKMMENLSIQPELLFSLQGDKNTTSYDNGFGSTVKQEDDLSLYYVNIPVMVKYYIMPDKFSLEAGPQIGFLTSLKSENTYTTTTGTSSTSSSSSSTDKTGFSGVDFGIGIGAAYNFTEHVFAGARYNIGLTNLYKDSGNYSDRNSVFQLSVGYMF